jgi:hypothetical protein
MAVLVYSELSSHVLDALEANVTTDAPIAAAEMARALNNGYQLVYENEGGGLTKVASATAWTTAESATGVVTGVLTDVKEVVAVIASSTSGSTGFSSGDRILSRVEYNEILYMRGHGGGHGTYTTIQKYSLSRLNTSTPASVGFMQLDYWPSVTGFYLPTHYIRQFVPIDSVTVTTPDCSDIGSRDIVWLAAIDLAPRIGRQRFIPTLQANLSKGMVALLTRKKRALETGDQNA